MFLKTVMLNNKFANRWVGSDINCCSPCVVAVNKSMSTVPSSDAIYTLFSV